MIDANVQIAVASDMCYSLFPAAHVDIKHPRALTCVIHIQSRLHYLYPVNLHRYLEGSMIVLVNKKSIGAQPGTGSHGVNIKIGGSPGPLEPCSERSTTYTPRH